METQTHTAAPARALRSDGWTPEIQHAFIEALARLGCVRRAAEAVGRSPSTAYRLRARPGAEAFRYAWDAAIGMAYARLTEIAMDRIQNGLEQRTYDSDGNLIARKTVYSDRLLMFLLKQTRPPESHVYTMSSGEQLLIDPPSRDQEFAETLTKLDSSPAPED